MKVNDFEKELKFLESFLGEVERFCEKKTEHFRNVCESKLFSMF